MSFTQISQYYDTIALAFSKAFAQGSGLMHLPLLSLGQQKSKKQRQFAAEELIAGLMEQNPVDRVLDLGCGFGKSLDYLSNIFPETIFSGLCSSETEILQARHIIRECGKIKSVVVYKGDFEESKNYRVVPAQNLVFAIDSVRHVQDYGAFFNTVHSILTASGRFAVVDCFIADTAKPLPQFLQNHYMNKVVSATVFLQAAIRAGFSHLEEINIGDRLEIPFLRVVLQSLLALTVGLFKPEYAQAKRLYIGLAWAYWRKNLEYRYFVFQKSP